MVAGWPNGRSESELEPELPRNCRCKHCESETELSITIESNRPLIEPLPHGRLRNVSLPLVRERANRLNRLIEPNKRPFELKASVEAFASSLSLFRSLSLVDAVRFSLGSVRNPISLDYSVRLLICFHSLANITFMSLLGRLFGVPALVKGS